MKGEVITQLGLDGHGKYSVAIYVINLEREKEASDLEAAVTSFIKDQVRHGMRIVPDLPK